MQFAASSMPNTAHYRWPNRLQSLSLRPVPQGTFVLAPRISGFPNALIGGWLLVCWSRFSELQRELPHLLFTFCLIMAKNSMNSHSRSLQKDAAKGKGLESPVTGAGQDSGLVALPKDCSSKTQ